MGLILLAAPIITLLILALSGAKRRFLYAVSMTSSIILAILGGGLTWKVFLYGSIRYDFLGGFFYLDALSIIILDLVLIIGVMANAYSIGYLEEKFNLGELDLKRLRLYYILMFSFMFTMILTLSVNNMGIMWIGIEGTTLSSAFLVGFHNDKQGLEAAWKYLIICSVGIAIALLGIIFLYLSSVGVFYGENLLNWTVLYSHAPQLSSSILRLAFVFVLVGFGTKAGLVPMHSWLPDAHCQAPSPISALLSGVLLNSAMYAIIRTVSIVNKNLGSSSYTGTLLMGIGLLSVAGAAVFILTQKDYKRLLAYSSIEHMGIIAFAVGVFTPASVFAALFHMINHSFTKSMLFLSSGSILHKYGSREISVVKGLLKILPVTGPVFLIGLFAIAGTPPFSIFASEWNILVAAFKAGHFMLGSLIILLLAIVFVGIAMSLFGIFYGNQAEQDLVPGETNILGTIAIVLLLITISVTGFLIPDVIKQLLLTAQRIVIGG